LATSLQLLKAIANYVRDFATCFYQMLLRFDLLRDSRSNLSKHFTEAES